MLKSTRWLQQAAALRTFLETNPPNNSAVYSGTLYEHTVQHALEHKLGMSLTRCGKAGDNGVDLMGSWHDLTILGQCKSSMSKVGGKIFREMEGVHSFHILETKEQGKSLMIVAAPSIMTQQGIAQFERTQIPMMFCRVEKVQPLFMRKAGKYDLTKFDNALINTVPNSAAQRLFHESGICL